MSDSLPAGWANVTLAEVAELNMGQSPDGLMTNTEAFGLPLIGGASDLGSTTPKSGRWTTDPKKTCEAGDLILCIRATIGKVNRADQKYALGRGVAGLRPVAIEQKLLSRFLEHQAEQLTAAGTGSTFVQIDKQTLTAWPLKLPPQSEQRRIVDRIETLFAHTQTARDELQKVPRLIERYKQAVFDRIFTSAIERSEGAVEFGQVISSLRNGLSRKPSDVEPGTPILRISSVRARSVNLKDHRFYRAEKGENLKTYLLEEGDLLAIRFNGNPSLVAAIGIVRGLTNELVYPDKLMRLRLNPERIVSEFAEMILASDMVRKQLSEHIKSAAGQHGISGGDLRKIMLPVPTLKDQRELVEIARRNLTKIETLTERCRELEKLYERLDQSILTKAFRGELVPHDPSDEPAERLLERIRAERAASGGAQRRRGRAVRAA